jgi:hypothetical protein
MGPGPQTNEDSMERRRGAGGAGVSLFEYTLAKGVDESKKE